VRYALGVVLDAAQAHDKVTKNVASPKLARIPRTASAIRSRRSLSKEEADDLMEKAEGHRLEALVGVMLWCGLRPGEVTGLTWDRINFKKETMAIRQSRKMFPDGTMDLGATKAESDRTIRIPGPVVELLRQHQVRQKEERLAAPVWEHPDLVFTNTIGNFIDKSNLRREVHKLCKDAGISPSISPNELRHTTATLLRTHAHVAPRDIADVLGNKDERMFDQHYFDRRAERVIDMTDAQGRMLSG
jgi:integrase